MVKRKSAKWKDLAREIRRSWARFMSILLIVLIGVSFFAGIKATAPDMRYTADLYFDDYNLFDIRVLSTLGLTDDDINSIKKIDSIEKISCGYFTDAVCTVDSIEFVFRLHSMPKNQKNQIVNQIDIIEGRYPSKVGECVLERSKNVELDLKIGDKLVLSSGKDSPITESTLRTDEFTIVGFAVSPYYLSFEKGASDIGNGKVSFFMMALEDNFTLPVYTEALITVKGAKELNTYHKEYKNIVENTKIALENMGVDRSAIRLNEIKAEAIAQLDEAKAEYNQKKQQFNAEIQQAAAELEQSKMELVSAEATLASEKQNFETNMAQARAQIQSTKDELEQGEIQYAQGLAEFNQMKEKYGQDLENLNSSVQQMNAQYQTVLDEINRLEQELEDPNLTPEERTQKQSLLESYRSLQLLLSDSMGTINNFNDYEQQRLRDAEQQLTNARAELDSGWEQVEQAEKDLNEKEQQANEEFANAQQEIDTGWAAYYKGKEEYELAKTKGEEELAAAGEKIIRAENDIERISSPQWYVLDRSSNYSFADYEATTKQIESLAQVFPSFFFLVAAMVCLTTMTRMVDEQRIYIGTYKALGYSNASISIKYVAYALAASILGSLIGLFAGMNIFPEVIYKSWSMKYTLPPLQSEEQIPLMIASALIGVLVTVVSAFAACYKELKETPSLLMRPKSPKSGKRILLEYITFIWKQFSFSQKVTARNLFRYKKRLLMTILGISGCTALLLAAFGLNDSISQVVDKQYNQIFKYDLDLRYSADSTKEEKQQVIDLLKENSNVKSILQGAEYNAKLKSGNKEISSALIVPFDNELFSDFITLRNRKTLSSVAITDDGIIITEKLAKQLSVGVGDSVTLDNGDGAVKKVKISGITENYVFHYTYMSQNYYKEIFRLEPKLNRNFIHLNDTSAQLENELANSLISNKSVASVTFYSLVAETFKDTVKSLNSIVLVIILCAGLLAFVVLYNLTNINISERIREIATIKVLGFYNREVSAYVFREIIILSILGSAIGLFLGVLLHSYIMVSIEQENVMFGNYLAHLSYLYSFILTLAFTWLVIVFMYRRLRSIPMVESLKSIE